jgi:hypothetical protein
MGHINLFMDENKLKKPSNQYDEIFNTWNIVVKMTKIVEI